MNSVPNTFNTLNLSAQAYMNGTPIAAGGNSGLQSAAVMGNGTMGGGGLMVGQMPPGTSQQQAALYHQYQQQLQAQSMNAYGKMPPQMMNTGGQMMAVIPQECSFPIHLCLIWRCIDGSCSHTISTAAGNLCHKHKPATSFYQCFSLV